MMVILVWLAKSTLVLSVGLLLARSKGLNAATRHAGLAFLVGSVPVLFVAELVASAPMVSIQAPAFLIEIGAGDASFEAMNNASSSSVAPASAGWGFWPVFWGLYAAISTSLLFALGFRLRQASRKIGQLSCIAQDPVEIRVGGPDKSPYAWGLLHRCVVVPEQWRSWDTAKQRSVLLHECAHLRRQDSLVALGVTCVCALFWMHPLLWVARRRCFLLAEHACDDAAINEGVEVTAYARHLLEISRMRTPRLAPAMAGLSQLSSRIHVLLDESTRRKPMTLPKVTTLICASALFVVAVANVGLAIEARADIPDVSADLAVKLATAQVHIDGEHFTDANRVLGEANAMPGLSANEQAQIARFSGYAAYHEEKYEQAITEYEKVLLLASSTSGLYQSTLYTLAQLHFVVGRYETAIERARQWMALVDNPGAVPSVFIAQTYYQMERYDEALAEMEIALAAAQNSGTTINPNWLKLRDYLLKVHEGEAVGSAPPHTGVDGDYYPIVKVAPQYPPAAREHQIEGYVVVEFSLDEDGRTQDHKIIESVPSEIFDRAALAAVRKFKYKPRLSNGQPAVVTGVRNKINFEL